jgi:hypothetical protein
MSTVTLPTHVLVVRAEVPEDIETEWNRWYDTVHLPEILACPGFRSGRRYSTGSSAAGHFYLALYDIDGPSALDSAEFKARRGWGPFAGKVKFETKVFSQLTPATA